MTDTYEIFTRTLERGLWIDAPAPGTQRTHYVIADIDGQKVASHPNVKTAVSVAYGKITQELNRTK